VAARAAARRSFSVCSIEVIKHPDRCPEGDLQASKISPEVTSLPGRAQHQRDRMSGFRKSCRLCRSRRDSQPVYTEPGTCHSLGCLTLGAPSARQLRSPTSPRKEAHMSKICKSQKSTEHKRWSKVQRRTSLTPLRQSQRRGWVSSCPVRHVHAHESPAAIL